MLRNLFLTLNQQTFLKSKGFIRDDNKHSGFYYLENEHNSIILIAYEDNSYKLEYFELCDDGNGNYYEDFSKEYSKPGETLEQFIERNI